MAQNFRRYKSNNVGTSAATIYTADSNDTIVGISVANVASATINVSVYITSGGNDIHLIKDTPIVQGSALQIIDGGARFVLQRNVIPIKVSNQGCFTPIGPIDLPIASCSLSPRELMVDDQSLLIKQDEHGDAIILGKEFLGGYWLLKVQIENLVLRVRHSLEIPLETGERCTVNFRTGCKGVLFPGSIPCLF